MIWGTKGFWQSSIDLILSEPSHHRRASFWWRHYDPRLKEEWGNGQAVRVGWEGLRRLQQGPRLPQGEFLGESIWLDPTNVCWGNWSCYSKITVTQLEPSKVLILLDLVLRLAWCSVSLLFTQLSNQGCWERWPSSSQVFLLSLFLLWAWGKNETKKDINSLEPDKGKKLCVHVKSVASAFSH